MALHSPAAHAGGRPHHEHHGVAGHPPQEEAPILQLQVLEHIMNRQQRALGQQRRCAPHLERGAGHAHRLAGLGRLRGVWGGEWACKRGTAGVWRAAQLPSGPTRPMAEQAEG